MDVEKAKNEMLILNTIDVRKEWRIDNMTRWNPLIIMLADFFCEICRMVLFDKS